MPVRSSSLILKVAKMVILTERQEEILSYLVGLAPIGEPIQVPHKWLETDFPGLDHSSFAQFIRRLLKRGAVEMSIKGTGATPSVLRVLKRPEEFEIISAGGRSPVHNVTTNPSPRIKYAGYDAMEAA
jgi:hypothetical protein